MIVSACKKVLKTSKIFQRDVCVSKLNSRLKGNSTRKVLGIMAVALVATIKQEINLHKVKQHSQKSGNKEEHFQWIGRGEKQDNM